MSRCTAGRLAWGSGSFALLLTCIGLTFALPAVGWDPSKLATIFMFVVLLIVYAIVGALIASRHPRNLIGWIFCGVAVALGVGVVAHGYTDHWLSGRPASQTLGETAAWYANVSYALEIIVPVIFLPLLFPDGRPLSRRWRPVAWLGALGVVAFMASEMLSAGPLEQYPRLQNPYASDSAVVDVLGPLSRLLLIVALLGAPLSLVLRFRRSGHDQRQQIKWLAWAGAVAGGTMMILLSPVNAVVGEEVGLQTAVIALVVLGLPVAAGVAILRYRLYEVDVVINRTLVYSALTATLAGTYLACVLLLQQLLSTFTTGTGLAVAVSTLAVAALFQPARRRIQMIVDRRFYRSKYDAERTLERFGARLRDEVDITALGSELRGVVSETMHPTHVSLWLRAPGPGR